MIFISKLLDSDFTIVVESAESAKNFREMVQRATNLWPDAPPEIKAFADKITNPLQTEDDPLPLQDYAKQNTSKKPVFCRHYESVAMPLRGPGWLKCKHCGYERDVTHPRDSQKEQHAD